MNLATEFNWKPAYGGWLVGKTDVCGESLCILKKGRTIAVTAASVAACLGVAHNRFVLPTYAKRMDKKITTIRIGSGFGRYKNGEVRAIYSSNLRQAMQACNVSVDKPEANEVFAVINEASKPQHDNGKKEESEKKLDDEIQYFAGELMTAGQIWEKTLSRVKRDNIPLWTILRETSKLYRLMLSSNQVCIEMSKAGMRLMNAEKIDAIEQALSEVLTRRVRCSFVEPEVKPQYQGQVPGQCALPIYEDIPFSAPLDELNAPTQEQVEEALESASDRDLINAMGSVVAGIANEMEGFSEDLARIESKIDRYTVLVARRNQLLASALQAISEIMSANLCSPSENRNGRWIGEGSRND